MHRGHHPKDNGVNLEGFQERHGLKHIIGHRGIGALHQEVEDRLAHIRGAKQDAECHERKGVGHPTSPDDDTAVRILLTSVKCLGVHSAKLVRPGQ